jgi:hypothetical protein
MKMKMKMMTRTSACYTNKQTSDWLEDYHQSFVALNCTVLLPFCLALVAFDKFDQTTHLFSQKRTGQCEIIAFW